MFNRDGSVRRSWYDPVGWAGLNKVTPFHEALAAVQAQRAKIAAQQAELTANVALKSQELRGLGIEAAAMQGQPHLQQQYQAQRQRITALADQTNQLQAQVAANAALLAALDQHEVQVRAGERGPLRDHIRRAHHPASDVQLRVGRLAEIWAAGSIGLALIVLLLLLQFARPYWFIGLIGIIAVFAFIESSFRGTVNRLVASVATALAVVAALVLLYQFFWPTVGLAAVALGGYMLWENLRAMDVARQLHNACLVTDRQS